MPRLTFIAILSILVIASDRADAQTSRPDLGLSHEVTRAEGTPLQVGILVLEGVYNSELAAPYDIFQHTVFHVPKGKAMKVFTVGRAKGLITTFEGLKVGVDYKLEDAPRIDVLVVPSAEHNMDSDLEDTRLIDWVREVGGKADYIVSVCDGAFVLAKAGLLDGLTCTTFPSDIAAFREKFPRLNVLDGPTWVSHGKAFTGVGGALSYDPPLALVAHIYGDDIAARVAPGLVLKWEERKAMGISHHGE
ncbi:MAG: DJ-1/PfpI family protein [Planctomycetota bacterium]|nr:DJ-1/PfpI family protein [Planctomycetota bacterium]